MFGMGVNTSVGLAYLNDWVDCLEMGWVGHKREMDALSRIELDI